MALKILRLREVKARTGLSRSTIYLKMAEASWSRSSSGRAAWAGSSRRSTLGSRSGSSRAGTDSAPPARSRIVGQLWGQQVVLESPGASVHAAFRAECEGRRPTNSTAAHGRPFRFLQPSPAMETGAGKVPIASGGPRVCTAGTPRGTEPRGSVPRAGSRPAS